MTNYDTVVGKHMILPGGTTLISAFVYLLCHHHVSVRDIPKLGVRSRYHQTRIQLPRHDVSAEFRPIYLENDNKYSVVADTGRRQTRSRRSCKHARSLRCPFCATAVAQCRAQYAHACRYEYPRTYWRAWWGLRFQSGRRRPGEPRIRLAVEWAAEREGKKMERNNNNSQRDGRIRRRVPCTIMTWCLARRRRRARRSTRGNSSRVT